MAIIVEDGTGKSDAESYVSVATADAYHLARANAAWADLETVDKEASLRKAVQYLDGTYWNRFTGSRLIETQALAWPRSTLVPVPISIKDAQCELALRAAAGELSPDLDRGGAVASKSVGSLSISYFEGAAGGKTYPLVDSILGRYLVGRSGGTLERG